jgi:hypothetical protein
VRIVGLQAAKKSKSHVIAITQCVLWLHEADNPMPPDRVVVNGISARERDE